MTAKIWEFRGVDTLFFRDGTPHNAGEGGGRGIKSIFPPYMFTLQGAVRTGLAMGQGWTPEGNIQFPKELGNEEELGDISFEGPYLRFGNDYIFPVPLNILHGDLKQFSRLIPDKNIYETDIGKVRLPVLVDPIRGAKTMGDFMIKKDVLERILSGERISFDKNDLIKKTSLWSEEDRVGITIERSTGATKDKMLYFTTHIRPEWGLSLVVKVKGINDKWHQKVSRVLPLGGEGRMAAVRINEDKNILPKMPELKIESGKIRYTVTLITPGCFWPLKQNTTQNLGNLIRKGFPSIPGKCVTACIDKLRQVGGFDIKNRKPRPLSPIIPEGSMWFYEGDAEDIGILKKLHGKALTPMGLNQIIIGNWGY